MTNLVLGISNHGDMLGGGEYSFLDLLSHLPATWKPIAVVPKEGELAVKLRERGIETYVLPLPAIRPWLLLNILSSLRAYFSVCRKLCPALIYANGSRAALYGGTVGRILKLPVIWHCRVAEPDVYLDFLLDKLSNCIVANSQATADRFKPHFQPKIRVVHNGVDVRWLRDSTFQKPDMIQDDWKVILKVARVSRWKRHDVVLKAFEQVAQEDPKVHLFCLGAKDMNEPEWWNYLQERTCSSPFSTQIHWVGQVIDIRPWYRTAHMLVLGSENEPFGRVLVETMACGVPVLATKSGGIPEIVRHEQDGLLVTPGKVEEMAEAMDKMLKDEFFRKNLVRSARERAESFSLDTHVAKMVQLFEDTII